MPLRHKEHLLGQRLQRMESLTNQLFNYLNLILRTYQQDPKSTCNCFIYDRFVQFLFAVKTQGHTLSGPEDTQRVFFAHLAVDFLNLLHCSKPVFLSLFGKFLADLEGFSAVILKLNRRICLLWFFFCSGCHFFVPNGNNLAL